jgi:XTP/dITP diphosphohydrolase
MQLLFASSNVNKLSEIREISPEGYKILSLSDMNFSQELKETGETLEENALEKARFVYQKFGMNCFSDDSGLEVVSLNGSPGVHSAYYAGLPRNDDNNISVLLTNLQGNPIRNARFRTVIALIIDKKEFLFEGQLNGIISTERCGYEGFGYDPVFIPDGYTKTLAELGLNFKNTISHRRVALSKLVLFLEHHKAQA